MSDRKDWFFDQRVTQAELDDSFNDLENADWKIVSDILGFGFLISGPYPATVEEQAVPDNTVKINPHLGYDQLGRRLENDLAAFAGAVDLGVPPQSLNMLIDENGVSTAVAAGGNEKTLTIFVEFTRKQSDARLDGNAATVFFEQEEAVKLNVVQSAEAPLGTSVPTPARSDQLILADVLIIFGQTSFQNTDIDQSRRQGFGFSLLHGSSHAENGTDPIPNAAAVAGQGGLLSGVDKIKLDGVDFTATGISGLFNNRAALLQKANFNTPASTALDVTGLMAGEDAGGSASKEAVATQSAAPNNRVVIKDLDYDDILDDQGNVVYGRLTVDNETTPTVWTLSFFSIREAGAGETAYDFTGSPHVGNDLQWWVTKAYSLENFPTFGSVLFLDKDQVGGEVLDDQVHFTAFVLSYTALGAAGGFAASFRVNWTTALSRNNIDNTAWVNAAGVITIPVSGRYRISYQALNGSGGANQCRGELRQLPATILMADHLANGSAFANNNLSLGKSEIFSFNGGDQIEIRVYHNGGAFSTSGLLTRISINRIGDV